MNVPEVTTNMYWLLGFCALTALIVGLLGQYYISKLTQMTISNIEIHNKLSDNLYVLREEMIKSLSHTYSSEHNSFLTLSYLDFLDRAYSARFGKVSGWSFKVPRVVASQPTIELELYFTSDEVEDIRKARDIYGEDLRLESFDKRIGL